MSGASCADFRPIRANWDAQKKNNCHAEDWCFSGQTAHQSLALLAAPSPSSPFASSPLPWAPTFFLSSMLSSPLGCYSTKKLRVGRFFIPSPFRAPDKHHRLENGQRTSRRHDPIAYLHHADRCCVRIIKPFIHTSTMVTSLKPTISNQGPPSYALFRFNYCSVMPYFKPLQFKSFIWKYEISLFKNEIIFWLSWTRLFKLQNWNEYKWFHYIYQEWLIEPSLDYSFVISIVVSENEFKTSSLYTWLSPFSLFRETFDSSHCKRLNDRVVSGHQVEKCNHN